MPHGVERSNSQALFPPLISLCGIIFLLNGDALGAITGAVAGRGRVQIGLPLDAPEGRLRRRPRVIVERRRRHDCPGHSWSHELVTDSESESARDLSPIQKEPSHCFEW